MLRALVLGLGLAFVSLGLAGPAQSAGTSEITLDQARQLAVHALRNGDPGLAIQVSKGLLQANPRDPLAYYIIAQAHAGLSQPNLGRRAAALAYRYADSAPSRFQAAQLASRMAYLEGKPTLAQVWLRRTAIHAPSKQAEALVGRDYRILRRINPWSLRLRADIRPSSNVNNGSDTALNIVDGVPVGGGSSTLSQALSGLIGSLDIATTYRLRADDRSSTSIGGRLYTQRVALSSAAKDLLESGSPINKPVGNSDYASTYAEVSLRHGFAIGQKSKGGSASVEVALGESWYAQQLSYRFGRITLERRWQLGQGRTGLTLNASGERRVKARSIVNNARILEIGTEIQHQLGNGDRFVMTLAFRDADAVGDFGTFTSASMRTSYTFAKPVGPAKLSAGLVLGYSNYPNLQTSSFPVTFARRQDRSIYADVSLFFDQYDYAGFAPLLRIRTGKRFSNFSRYETREFSVSLGIQSKF